MGTVCCNPISSTVVSRDEMPSALVRGPITGPEGTAITTDAMARLVAQGFRAIMKKELAYNILPDIDFDSPKPQTCALITAAMVEANGTKGITTWQKRRDGPWYVETFNSAVLAGSWLMVGLDLEVYIVRGNKVGLAGTPGIVYIEHPTCLTASQELRHAKLFREAMIVDLQLQAGDGDSVNILASWGELMTLRDGDLLMRSDGGYYSITEKAAKATYDWVV